MIKGRSVFIVDNDKHVVDLLKEILENEGIGVVVAYCGEAAIAKLRNEKCHCAVLDSLPDVKGDELAKSFRVEVPDIGIILLTGFKSSIDPVKLEAFDYVFEKPVNLEALIAAVKQITSKSIREFERACVLQSNRYLHLRSAQACLG